MDSHKNNTKLILGLPNIGLKSWEGLGSIHFNATERGDFYIFHSIVIY